ncbi:MAG: 2-oxo acid dehydrogenase subunit E2 [Chloroflexi bacterium]|nr:2-oxo acid dehydrogenase subunit E2 [Chloroflexota bacterium]
MSTSVLVPILGEAISEARVTTWLKQIGDPVRRGDELAELETDKAVLALECPADGLLLEILIGEGVLVTAGQLLARVGRLEEVAAQPPAAQPPAADERRRISPAARRLARQHGLDLAALAPALPGARITTHDVHRQLAGSNRLPQRQQLLTETQRVMATRMAQSAREIPQFSATIECDASRLLAAKEELANRSLSLTALLAGIVARVLLRHPLLNSRYAGESVILYTTVNLGIAVTTPQGLVVPVLHHAETLAAGPLAEQLTRLVQAAREGRLSLAQVSDGTFTLSNLGMYGVSHFIPLVNPPQAAILGVAGIHPTVVPTATGTRHCQRMALTVSADHRVVDGAAAALFLQDLQHTIEETPLF